MTNHHRLSLVGATLRAGLSVTEKLEKSANAQKEVIETAWPSEENLTKKAQLSRIIATGMLVEEAEHAEAAQAS